MIKTSLLIAIFLKVNCVGSNKKEISLGNTIIIDSTGNVLKNVNKFEEEIMKFNTKDRVW